MIWAGWLTKNIILIRLELAVWTPHKGFGLVCSSASGIFTKAISI